MNHRELILSSRKKTKSAFLTLPEDLQDEIVSGFDNGTLTLQAASARIKERGFNLSYAALSLYYGAVRRERRLLGIEKERA